MEQHDMSISHSPKFYPNPGSDSVVVFIHGFMGSPRQFDWLAQAVSQQNCSAATLLLPGHGGSASDFGAGTFNSWQNHVDSEIGRLAALYKNIWLAGHSMGGLLAINAAVRFEECVRGLFTIACPFKISGFSANTLKVRLNQIFGGKGNPLKTAYLSNSSVALSPGLLWHAQRPAAELKKLMSAARSNLGMIRVPFTAVYSTSDELTSIASLKILKAGLNTVDFKAVVLSESVHAFFPEHEKKIIELELLSLVAGIL